MAPLRHNCVSLGTVFSPVAGWQPQHEENVWPCKKPLILSPSRDVPTLFLPCLRGRCQDRRQAGHDGGGHLCPCGVCPFRLAKARHFRRRMIHRIIRYASTRESTGEEKCRHHPHTDCHSLTRTDCGTPVRGKGTQVPSRLRPDRMRTANLFTSVWRKLLDHLPVALSDAARSAGDDRGV